MKRLDVLKSMDDKKYTVKCIILYYIIYKNPIICNVIKKYNSLVKAQVGVFILFKNA